MQNFQDIEHFVKTLSAAIKKKIPTKVSQLTNDVGYKTTDTDTTYKLSKSGSTVTLTGSDGSTTSVTDDNTTYSSLKNPYSLTIQNNGTTVASYDGSTAKTANFTNATASANGLMSKSDKVKLDGIDPSAITTNAANIKKNADAISAETTRAKAAEKANADTISAEVTRAKKAEEANTQLTNDLKTGLTSGTVKVAKATVADSASSLGKVSTYQTEIPDNGGRRKYLLMYDITDWISAKFNASTRAFDGYFFSRRSGGHVGTNYTGNLSIVASYNGVNSDGSPIKSDNGISLRLRTTSSTYVPRILHQKSNDKYYLSLMTGGSGRDLILFGIFQGTFIGTWINNERANNSNGTLPSDYEEYSDGFYIIPYERAIADKNGKDITEYLVAAAYADGAFTFTRGNGSKTVLTIPDTVSNTVNSHIANKSNPHGVTKAQVGLGNVDNTADSAKSVKYAASAGSANAVAWGNVSDKPSTYPPSSHTHTKAQVGLSNVANLDQSKAIKSITRNGTTFTATALDGTTSTFTQQDSNTTYGIATSSSDGLMSKTDKAKLDGIGAGSNVKSVNGKTGAVSLSKADVGLGNVDNTRDADKPYYKLIGNYNTHSNDVGNCKWNEAKNSLYKIKNFYAISGEGDYFYLAHKKHEYTITATKQFSQVNNMFTSNLSSDCFIRTDLCSEADPAILTIIRDYAITATDVVTLLFIQHAGGSDASQFNHWKLEILADRDSSKDWPNATVTWKADDWITVFERTNVSDVPNALYCCLNPYNKNGVSYIHIKGIRLTIYAATPRNQNPGAFGYNSVPIGRLCLLDSRPSFSPAEALGALDVAGGTVYGKTTFQEGISATSYSGASATSSADGLMSKSDKAKLDGIGAGSNVKSVNGKTGAVTLAKGDVGLGSVANYDQSKAIKSITRSGTTFTATALDGTTTTFTQQDNNTTYGVATSSADGLMSKSDKAKLDGISSGADAVTIKTVKVNGTALTPDSNKAVNVTVPTLANNATTTASGMALDARMGKTLSDQIASVKTGAIDQIINLTAAGWTGDAAPYSQTVNVTGMTDELLCELFSACPKTATVAEREAYNEAFALVASGYAETADGSATFLVDEKPVIDIGVRIKSISKANAVSDQTSSDITSAVDAMSNTLEGRVNALNLSLANNVPTNSAWAHGRLDGTTVNLMFSHNVESITTSDGYTFYVKFSNPFPDEYYAAVGSFDIGGMGQEIGGVYGYGTAGFSIDVQNASGNAPTPSIISVIALR